VNAIEPACTKKPNFSENVIRILESITDSFLAVDEDWRLVFMNTASRRSFAAQGLNPDDLLGKHFWEEIFPEGRGTIAEREYGRAMTERVPRDFEYFFPPWQRWFAVRAYPIEEGGISIYFIDITERKRADVLLRIASERYQTLSNSIDEGFCTIEVLFDEQEHPYDYRFLEINPAFEKQTGLKDAVGKRIRELAPEHETHWYEIYGQVALTGQPIRFENQAEALNRWFDVFAFRIGEPEQRRVAVLFTDITKRRLAEEELREAQTALAEQNRLLDQTVQQRTARLEETIAELESFSYSISHDMRAPLRAMHGFAEALLQDYGGRLDSEAAAYLQRIQKAAGRLDLLIQDVLVYSKVAKGDVYLKAINLEHLIADVVQNYPNLHPSKVRVIISPLPLVMGHEGLLTQIVSNLIGNAVKFAIKDRFPEVRISAETLGPDVRIWFEDNGIGIAPEHHERIFKIFGRVHPDKVYEGTGIGLAIVRKAAERIGGSAGVVSELGKGSRFWVNLKKSP
jgi:PAS domain S-box-containing protein